MVFQNYALYPHMTVRENMGFALMLAKVESSVLDTKVGRAAEILGLTQLLDRYPRQLSGGQRQRVAMGRAIVRDPQGVPLPTSRCPTSTPSCAWPCAPRSRNCTSGLSTTSIYVTHDQIEAMTMGDQIVVMRDGHIEQTGDPLSLYDRRRTSSWRASSARRR